MYTVSMDRAELMKLPQRDVRCFIGTEKMDTPVHSDRITMGLTEVPAQTDMIPHSHSVEEELIFIIEGTGAATIGGVTEELAPFTAAKFPCGIEHQVRNTGETPMRFVFMFGPAFSFGR